MSEWIKTENELPPLDLEVLGIYDRHHYIVQRTAEVMKPFYEYQWIESRDISKGRFSPDEITHWQHLPVIPTTEEK